MSKIYQSSRIQSELQLQPGPGYKHAPPLKGIHQCLMEVKEDGNNNKETNSRNPQIKSKQQKKKRQRDYGNFNSENEKPRLVEKN